MPRVAKSIEIENIRLVKKELLFLQLLNFDTANTFAPTDSMVGAKIGGGWRE